MGAFPLPLSPIYILSEAQLEAGSCLPLLTFQGAGSQLFLLLLPVSNTFSVLDGISTHVWSSSALYASFHGKLSGRNILRIWLFLLRSLTYPALVKNVNEGERGREREREREV